MLINDFKRKFNRIKEIYYRKRPPQQKTYANWLSKNYIFEPQITFIIQSHNKSGAVIQLVSKLRQYEKGEIIVIDDGSKTEHTLKLVKFMTKANEFILRSNDLYETITYDRAIYMARGEIVLLLQDDDAIESLDWISEGLSYFKKYPDLVLVGCKQIMRLMNFEKTGNGTRGEYLSQDEIAYRNNSFKFDLMGSTGRINTFQFAQTVCWAPMFVHRQLFLDNIKNIDQSYAPFMWDYSEICLKAWLLGLKVGWFPAKLNFGALGVGGMRIWNQELHNRQDEINVSKLYKTYGNKFQKIDSLVTKANNLLI